MANAIKLKSKSDDKWSLMAALNGTGGDMDQDSFDKVFVHPDGFNHILLSDVQRINDALVQDFKDIVTVESIGKTWENRDIQLITIDARA